MSVPGLDALQLGAGAGVGAGHQVHHRAQQGGHAHLAVGRGQEDRVDGALGRALLQAGDDVLAGEGHLLQVLLGQGVVGAGGGVEELLARRLDLVGHVPGDVHLDGLVAVELEGLHLDQVDDALEVLADADGQLAGGHAGDAVAESGQRAGEVRVLLVHAVDHDEGGQRGLAQVVPEVLRGHLEAAVGLDDEQHALDHAQGRVDVAPEVVHARGVDDVDLRAPELGPGQAAADGLLAFDLLLQVVEDRGAVVDVSAPAHLARDVEHGVGEAGLADPVGCDQGHVADLVHRVGLQRSSSQFEGAGGSASGPGAAPECARGPVAGEPAAGYRKRRGIRPAEGRRSPLPAAGFRDERQC